jgi:hypothetical protein
VPGRGRAIANVAIHGRPASWPTAWLIAAYIPTGKTVLQRREPAPARGRTTSPAISTGSQAIASSQRTNAAVSRASPGGAAPNAVAVVAAASAAIASAPPAIHWSPRPDRISARSNPAAAQA